MQDVHSIGGGRFFAAAGGGGDRRLRPHHHHHHHHHHQNQQQALKCPRCDSLNTKFCYYNNYNLSQPRHFCKNCRRYWTKGGVLRNVPVGGGCRKTKRSKPKASSAATETTPPPPAAAATAAASQDRKSNSNSHSSSESSSLTATNTNAATEAVSAPSTSSGSNLLSINNNNNNHHHNNQESKFFVAQSTSSNPSFEPAAAMVEQGGSDCGIFSEIGSFTSLITSSSTGGGAMAPFEFNSISDITISAPFRLNHQHQNQNQSQSQSWHQQQNQKVMSLAPEQELKMQEITAVGLLDQTTSQADLSVLQDRSNGGGFGSLGDWQSCGDQGLFDLPNTVDQAYWSQSQWTDQDHPSLYLP